jgi:hypothetical protein
MQKRIHELFAVMSLLTLMSLFTGCSGGSTSPTAAAQPATAATASLNVTDAPTSDFEHVYVTVTQLAFHTDANAGFTNYSTSKAEGWQIYRLATPVTIDLTTLANGSMYSGTGGNPLFNGLNIPQGSYNQIRIFLAPSEGAYVGSIAGLTYNNEVVLPSGPTEYILRIPTAGEGIKVLPDSAITSDGVSNINLALDFNLSDDIVVTFPNGTREYIMKPRLSFFDMNSVGAVTGVIGFPNLSTSRFIVKAEYVPQGASYRVTRRLTTNLSKTNGTFNLYPIPVFGGYTTATYDILLRGLGVQTAVIKGVKVHKGTTVGTGVNLGTIPMTAGSDYTVQLSSPMHPTGAWINFYQTIAGDPTPYEVRYVHLDPYTGLIPNPFPLSKSPFQVATFNGGSVSFTQYTSNQGRFSAIAVADRYTNGLPTTVTPAIAANGLITVPPPTSTTWGSITATVSTMRNGQVKGYVLITEGGLIIDSCDMTNIMLKNGGNAPSISVPAGSSDDFYGVTALGWGSDFVTSDTQTHLDLTTAGTSLTPLLSIR